MKGIIAYFVKHRYGGYTRKLRYATLPALWENVRLFLLA